MCAWKILLTDGLEKNGQDILRKQADVDVNPTITADELLNAIGEYDAIIVRGREKVTPALLAAGKKLRVVGRAGVGIDNIDTKAAIEHNVCVVNSPTATTQAVAELALGLMLALVRDIPRADAGMKSNQWLKKELMGTELSGKTLGVIGFGRIGVSVAKMASAAFNMKIIAYDPLLSPAQITERGGHPVSLPELYTQADVITLHVPLTADTRSLLNADAFAQMKDGVRIICAARGGVIDEEALLNALNSGKVAGAGLDVFSAEPPGQSPLTAHPKVIGTPHVGAQTEEAQERAAEDIANEVLNALAGKDLRWRCA